jgi:hypothetical protein
MQKNSQKLGDFHNFGRSVVHRRGRVHKPRAVLWEWLLLGHDSPLRGLLAEAAERDGLGDAFGFLPTLRFHRTRSPYAGDVEALRLEPLRSASRANRRELAVAVGRSLALWSWLGVSDLHWENLALGVDERGRIVFGPLDIEMIFDDFELPTQTKLLPDADPEYAVVCQHAAGLRRVLPYLGKPIDLAELFALLAAYRAMLAFLERHASAIGKLLSALPALRQTPIRVCLRGTEEYLNPNVGELWPPLLDAEAEQLARGDVPYFFRLYGRPGIHYFADRSLSRVDRIPLRGDVPKLLPLLPLARGLRSEGRRKLSVGGLFAAIAALDHPEFAGAHHDLGLELRFGRRSLKLVLEDGEELTSARDLRAFVSSLYMPCRCGEVRTVLVPEVTRCRAPLDSV